MKSKQKAWVIALTLACFFIGACAWVFMPNKNSVNAAGTPKGSHNKSATISLHVGGRYSELPFADAADLPEEAEFDLAKPLTLTRMDVNGDGMPDLVTTYLTSKGSELRVRLGESTGSIDTLPKASVLGNITPKAMAFGDFNLDGFQDMVSVNGEVGTVSIFYGDGQGAFQVGPTLSLGGTLNSLAVADIDRDGIEDIVVLDAASSNLRYIVGNGNLSKAEIKTIDTKGLGRLAEVRMADFNNDYYQDIVVASNSGLAVMYGDGKGHFNKEVRLPNNTSINSLVVADLDGDHFPDLAISSPEGVTVWHSRLQKGFSAAKSFAAGENAGQLVAGRFNADDLTDLAVINKGVKQVSVLLNEKGKGFSQPLPMDLDNDAEILATGNFRLNGNEGIAIAKKDGRTVLSINPAVITIQVSTLFDENDCPGCTSAQLIALKGPNGEPGGSTGISLREALTSINNDFLILGKANEGVGFQTLSSATSTANIDADAQTFCSPAPGTTTPGTNSYWLINLTALGDLPPLLAPGIIIDGTVVTTNTTTTTNGVNNTLGPKVVLTGGGIIITSSAPNTTVKGLAITNTPNNGIIVSSSSDIITANNIGLDCDTITPGTINGNGIVLTGSSNTMVTSNFIGAATMNGILVNGISRQVPIPQNNVFDKNFIGINRVSTTIAPLPLIGSVANGLDGILVQAAATGNTISNSVIGGNLGNGINIKDNITSNTIVRLNRIGVDPSGQFARPNGLDGVAVSSTGNSKFNSITQNLISGNGTDPNLTPPAPGFGNGVSISSGDTQAQFNVVAINRIGVNSTGSVQIPNFGSGVLITGAANGNTIGGSQRATFNQISGNGGTGVFLGTPAATGSNPNNNLIEFNDIGANNTQTGAPFDPVTPAMPAPRSNKGGGIFLNDNAFANIIIANNIAFNNDTAASTQPNPPTTPPPAATSGITNMTATNTGTSGNFNTFTQNNIFLNPPDMPLATTPNISLISGNEGMTNAQIVNPTAVSATQLLMSLIKVDSAITITNTGQTTVKGTANFLDNAVPGNINNAQIEIFVSQRGAEANALPGTPPDQFAEGQLFLNSILSLQPDPNNPNTLDWSASLVIPAPFINPVQTNTVFLTATITTGDGSTSPFSIGLTPQFVSGVGQCNLGVSPTTISFPNAPVNQTSTQSVVLSNNGSSLITISSIAFAQSTSVFTLSGVPSLPFTLAAGQSQTIMVSFKPTNNTSSTNSLIIGNSCTGTTTAISITGNGCQPTLAATPSPVNFGTVAAGSNNTMNVTVTNTGCTNQPLQFVATLGANTSPSFSIVGVTGAVITIGFAPGSLTSGQQTGTLVITSSTASNSPLNIQLIGNSTVASSPVLRLQPNSINFGDVPVGTTATQSVSIINAGSTVLTFSTPTVQAGSTFYTVTAPARLSLNVGESTTFQVSFTPTSTGSKTGSIQVISNADTQTIALLGNGIAPTINVLTPALDFGATGLNQTVSRSAVISNTGSAVLNITSFSINGASSGFALPNTTPFTINVNSQATIVVNFTPTTVGAKSGTLTINSNDPTNSTSTVGLTGSGTDNAPPIVQLIAPVGSASFSSGGTMMIVFNASDNVGVTNYEVRLSTNGGASYDTNIASGSAQTGQNSLTAVLPTLETTTARIEVVVRDAANNVGMAFSTANLTIGTGPSLFGSIIVNGRFKTLVANSNIQAGASLVVNGDTFPLVLNAAGSKYIVRPTTTSASGRRLSDLVRPGGSITVTVRNPNGISSAPVTITAR